MISRVFMALVAFISVFASAQGLVAKAGSDEYDVVVIGAGGGGLAAAARLSIGGMRVLLLEQHYKVGGYMTSFERGPYTFEVSLHALDGHNQEYGMNRWLFRELGISDKVELITLAIPYRGIYPDMTVEVPADVEEYKARLIAAFPHEKDGIEDLFDMLSGMAHAIRILMSWQEGDILGAAGLVLKKPLFFVPLFKYSDVTVSEMLDDYIHDEKLRSVFEWLCYYAGAPPDELPAIVIIGMWSSYHYGGWFYVKGGSQAVSNALAEVIKENGGDIELSTRATKITVRDGRAVSVGTEDGREFACRYVVSNANAPDTLFRMVGREHLPADYLERVDALEIGTSICVVYMGVDHDYSKEFAGAHSISVDEVYDKGEAFRFSRQGLVDRIGYVLVNYSLADPQVAPPGKNVISITTYLPYDWKDGWYEAESYEKYRALKEDVAWTLIRRAERVLPELGSHIEVLEVGSPRTMEHFTLNPGGAIYGWAVTPDMRKNGLPLETPVPNLFLAGAWTNAAGQNGVMRSGLQAALKIIEIER